ncbi:MAG TPA: hypothetical protein VF017_15100 [Thermoanaerobaculia bacterium]|nr:hypothetical protein [Thermoanaerobaculia bacterium]
MNARAVLLLAGLGLAAGAAVAQEGAATARIVSVSPQTFAIGSKLVFETEHLDRLCPGRAAGQELRLFLDGRPLPGVEPLVLAPDRVRFDLEPSWARRVEGEEGNVWAGFASGSLFGPRSRTVQTSLGYDACPGGAWAQTPAVPLTMTVLSNSWRLTWIVCMLAIVGLTVWLARNTPLLREGGASGPYSLARTQIAFWTVLALGAFLLILMSTGSVASLNGDVLVLLGISGATGLSSAVIDSSKKEQMARKEALDSQKTRLAGLDAESQRSAPVLDQQRQVAVELAQLPSYIDQPKASFIPDLLKDENGYSIYRLQFFLWTLVLGGWFLYAVVTRLTMPSFSTELLTLMGISSGTYVSLKTQEKQV